jgi:hypothetical protein
MTGAELLEKELTFKSIPSFDSSALRATTTVDKTALPDQDTIQKEQAHMKHLVGISSFDHSDLSHVKHPEPLTGAELLEKELAIKSIPTFDSSALRATTTKEKTMLPDQSTIHKERAHLKHLNNIGSFDHSDLDHVKHPKPLTGAELLQKELTAKSISTFDSSSLRATTTMEKTLLPDKDTIQKERAHIKHLVGIGSFDHSDLTNVKTLEPMTGAELLQQELTVKSIPSFDSSALHATTTMDKTVLPDQDTIQKERTHIKHLVGIGSFDHSDLTHVKHPEPMTGTELLEKELTIKSIPSFDSSSLSATITTEKTVLPDQSTIEKERAHLKHLNGIGSFDHSDLTNVKHPEPLTGHQLARQESLREEISSELAVFDSTALRRTITSDMNLLPDKSTIQQEQVRRRHFAGIHSFDHSDLAHVKSPEPLSGRELARQESLREDISSELAIYDKAKLTRITVDERNILPTTATLDAEKKRESLLNSVEQFTHHELNPVKSPEPLTGAAMLQQEQTVKLINEFDSTTLQSTTTYENITLPDRSTIKQERAHLKHLDNIGSFDHSDLAHVKAPEPMTGAELLQQELTVKAITDFDSSTLRAATTNEKSVLPDAETLQLVRRESLGGQVVAFNRWGGLE